MTTEFVMPKFYDTIEVSKLFSVTPETVRNWVVEGKFPNTRRVGRKYMIPETDLQALLSSTYGEKPDTP